MMAGTFARSASAGTTAEDAVIDDSVNWTALEGFFEKSKFDSIDLAAAAASTGHSYNPTYAADTAALFADSAPSVSGPYSSRNAQLIQSGITEASDAGGIGIGMAAARYLPIAATIGTGLLTGWQIGGAIDHWLGISEFFGNTTTFASNYGSGQWVSIRCTNSSGAAGPGNGTSTYPSTEFSNQMGPTHGQVYGDLGDCLDAISTYGLTAPFTIYMAVLQRTVGSPVLEDPTDGTWDNNFSCGSPCSPGSSTDANMRAMMMSIESTYGSTHSRLYYRQGSDSLCSPGCVGQMYLTQAQMNLTRAITTPGGTTNPGGTPRTVSTPVPFNSTCTYSSTCGTTIRTYIKSHTIAEKWIVHEIDPGVEPDDPGLEPSLSPLQPLPNETYTDYATRLTADGWLGSVTSSTEESPALEGYGPLAVTRLTYTAVDGLVKTLDPLRWPTSAPAMADNVDIVLRYNPSGVTPAPTDTPASACGTIASPCYVEPASPDAGSGGSLHWPSISSPCDKFPFGVFCWVGGALASISGADATAPSITLPSMTIPNGSDVFGGSGSWDTPEITWSTDEIPSGALAAFYIISAAIAFFVWFFGLWFVGSRMVVGRGVTLEGGSDE
jgi:hypothetical protein